MTVVSKTEFCELVPAEGACWRSQPNAFLFSDEAWFLNSWYAWPLKITLTVMLIHGVPLCEVKVWRAMCYKCN